MSSPLNNRSVVNKETQLNQNSEEQKKPLPLHSNSMINGICQQIIPNLSNPIKVQVDNLNELPIKTVNRLVNGPLDALADKLYATFSESECRASNPQFIQFISSGFNQIITSLINESKRLPPNLFAVCRICEAAFSDSTNKKPIVVTDSLATCIGVAGYSEENHKGFVIHFASEGDVQASGKALIEKIGSTMKNPLIKPIQLHLRGGVKGLSKPLVQAIKEWITLASSLKYPMGINTEEILTNQVGTIGITTMSLSLDTWDGTVGTYDYTQDPYARERRQVNNEKEASEALSLAFEACAMKEPGIKIVYQ